MGEWVGVWMYKQMDGQMSGWTKGCRQTQMHMHGVSYTHIPLLVH
jgi:hypothetical protein